MMRIMFSVLTHPRTYTIRTKGGGKTKVEYFRMRRIYTAIVTVEMLQIDMNMLYNLY